MIVSQPMLIVLLTFGFAKTDRGSRCVTPNQEEGLCKPVKDCKPIRDAVTTLETSAIDFAKESQCGVDNNEQLVCCGSLGNYTEDREEQRFLEQQSVHLEDGTMTTSRSFDAPQVKTSAALGDKLPDKSICGIQSEETRIIGGETTEIGEFPWMALLRYKNLDGTDAGFQCGGTLINNRYVLTAAHCLRGTVEKEFKIVSVRLGEWNMTSMNDCYAESDCADTPEDIDVEEEVVHPYFSLTTGNNDIALLRLKRRVQFTDYIRPICLPPSNLTRLSPGTVTIVAGWGISKDGTQSDVKLKLSIPVVSNQDCSQKIRRSETRISENQLCAGGERGKDACKGDSGGPLMNVFRSGPLKGQWYQEGVVSKGIGCGAGYPGIYTRVARFFDWIVNNLQP